jgi:hypothetical protein
MSDESAAGEELQIELSATHIEMQPGARPIEVTLLVHNRSRVVEQCTVEVVGIDADWFTHPARSVALFPGDSERLNVAFHVPNQPSLRAGTYPFSVVVRSRSSGVERRVEGAVSIPGEAAYAMDIAPRRLVFGGGGRFRVLLTNSGMADGELQLEASDVEEGVAFEFPQDQRRVVPANSTVEVPLVAVPRRRPWVGPERTYDFQVTARQPGSVAEVRSVHGQLVYRPHFASLGLVRRAALLAGLVVVLLVGLSALPSDFRCRLVGENGSVPVLGRGCGPGEVALTGGASAVTAAQTGAGGSPTAAVAGNAAVAGGATGTGAGGGVVAAGGGTSGGTQTTGGAGTAAPTPGAAAGQQAAGIAGDAIGGGGGAAGAGMTLEGVPTLAPPAATAAAVLMAGVDATQAAVATAAPAPATLPNASTPTPAPSPAAVATPAVAAGQPGASPTPAAGASQTPAAGASPTAQATLPPPTRTPTAAVVAAQFQPGRCSAAQTPPPTPAPTRGVAAKPGVVPSNVPRLAVNDWSASDPTVWWMCTGVTADQIGQFLKTNQARLVDVEVEQAQPTLLLSAVAVANQGVYARDWSWYYGLTDDQVQDRLTGNSARPIALKAYDAGGGKIRFAVVMVSNKAPDMRNYWWYPDLATPKQIDDLLTVNKARLVDADPYLDQGRHYAVIMLANTGADQTNSWRFDNLTTDQISAQVTRTGGHVIDIEPNNVASGTFDVIVEGCPCAKNWWAAGLDDAGLTSALAQTRARITSMATYLVQGQRRFAVSLIDNT